MADFLDGVKWELIPGAAPVESGLPAAVYRGVFRVGDIELRCYQLDDGRRIIDADDVVRLLGLSAEFECPLSAEECCQSEPCKFPGKVRRALAASRRKAGK